MLVYYKVLQGVHGQEIAQNVFRDIIIDPPDKVYVQLPEAYRSLSRPSSAPSAKASALHP